MNMGKVDILVNNAGICQFKPFLELTEEEWDRTININLKGYFLCAQACAKEMAKQKSGAIVNIASIAMGQVGVGFPRSGSLLRFKRRNCGYDRSPGFGISSFEYQG